MIRFRASSAGNLMIGGRKKDEMFGQTALNYIRETWIAHTYGRTKEISSKYLDKGNECEEASISLLQEVEGHRVMYVKNEANMSNEYITGTPDLYTTDEVIDIKTSWDIFTFHAAEVTPVYYAQLQCYMRLLKMQRARLVFCLVDAPEWLILKECTSLFYRLGGDNMPESQRAKYERKCEQIRRNMTFADIAKEKRVKCFDVHYSEEFIDDLFSRVKAANEIIRGYGSV
jgi:hypothetical protein